MVVLIDVVPYFLDDELMIVGVFYQKVEDWHPLAVVDGLVITGQNPASSQVVAQALLQTAS